MNVYTRVAGKIVKIEIDSGDLPEAMDSAEAFLAEQNLEQHGAMLVVLEGGKK